MAIFVDGSTDKKAEEDEYLLPFVKIRSMAVMEKKTDDRATIFVDGSIPNPKYKTMLKDVEYLLTVKLHSNKFNVCSYKGEVKEASISATIFVHGSSPKTHTW